MAVKIQNRADSKLNWESYNPILALGEFGLDVDSNSLKIGDGISTWNELDYVTSGTGLTPPNLTTAQRDSIPSPILGLTIYNTDNLTLESYNGYGWAAPGGDTMWDGGGAGATGGTIIDGGNA